MDQTNTLAELVAEKAGAARVLQRHGLDFCCGGRKTLAEACAGARIEPERVLAEIVAAESQTDDTDASRLPPEQLADYVVRRYHDPLRPELARLIELARKAERAHGSKAEWPAPLVMHLENLRAALEEHMMKEEQILFPAIRAGRGHLARMPIQVMIREHEDHGENLERTRELTGGFQPPESACATWRALYAGLAELELELMTHIHLENNVLFPRALMEKDNNG